MALKSHKGLNKHSLLSAAVMLHSFFFYHCMLCYVVDECVTAFPKLVFHFSIPEWLRFSISVYFGQCVCD